MSTATGYYRPGTSWLHRRNPLTKLLAVALILLATFLLSAVVLPFLFALLVVVAWSTGLGRDILRALRIPAVLVISIIVVNALFFPAATDRLVSVGPFAVTREGLSFGLISAGRLIVAFLVLVAFLFTTLADDLLESLVARGASHRIAFVVLSAVQMVP
ncbi:MAG TPA: energy-coupling factor transporter transmembrane component T, partial [Patescibacteria group bacterium]|nr:energy-coupling factor transporter transmembrane component T [Patescibacteria group bacterium]